MNGALIPFERDGWNIRVVDVDGDPWFVASDVARALGYSNPQEAVRTHCKGVRKTLTPSAGGDQQTTIIPESDVYRLIIRSKLPEAEKFEKWVMEEVLPTIRRTGAYGEMIPKTYADALRLAADQQEQIQQQATVIDSQRPKVEFYDTVTDSKDAIEMKDAAKVLDCGIGRNRLFQLLRDEKILMSNNTPYQAYVDRRYFRVIEQKYTRADGETRINLKTVIYQRGLDFIRKIVAMEKPA